MAASAGPALRDEEVNAWIVSAARGEISSRLRRGAGGAASLATSG
jgi:hypothetical protein